MNMIAKQDESWGQEEQKTSLFAKINFPLLVNLHLIVIRINYIKT